MNPGQNSSRTQAFGHAREESGEYLLEKDYLLESAPTPRFRRAAILERVARVTAKCVARWADRYRVRHLVRPLEGINRDGALPSDPAACHTLIDSIIDSFLSIPDPQLRGVDYLCLDLYQMDRYLLNQGDGIMESVLYVSPEELRVLQDCWEGHDLPRDLYYPANERQVVLEAVDRNGKPVSVPRIYTPRQWSRRSG